MLSFTTHNQRIATCEVEWYLSLSNQYKCEHKLTEAYTDKVLGVQEMIEIISHQQIDKTRNLRFSEPTVVFFFVLSCHYDVSRVAWWSLTARGLQVQS